MDDLRGMIGDAEGLEGQMRRVTELMALCLQGSLLVRLGDAAVAEAFCASRLGGRFHGAFGTLPKGVDLDALIGRAMAG